MENNFICLYCGKECKSIYSLKTHERLCKENPNHVISPFVLYNKTEHIHSNLYIKAREKGILLTMPDNIRKKISETLVGNKHTDEQKRKISESMKKAHAEGRAHNIGLSRWNNEPSYPEKWFMNVIKNEFINKDYIKEYPFFKYSLDFVWLKLKVCIEIDGELHLRFDELKKRDLEKDKLLKQYGWKELRIPWKDCFNNPKKYIELVRTLID